MPLIGDDLVGRSAELATLDALLDSVERGGSSVIVVTGEAGIGKTALLEELSRRADARGFSVAVGRCAPSASPPYWPWPRVLRSLGGTSEEIAAATVGGRAGLFAAAADRLEQASARRPVVVVVDDLQWADESALALGAFLVAGIAGLPVALAFGVRDEPAGVSPGLREMLAALPADVMRVPLAGLDRMATADLLAKLLGERPPPEMAEQMHDRTGGNPLFVTECGHLFAAKGPSSAALVPEGVRQVITRRLATLSQPSYTVLAAASVIDDFDTSTLAQLTDLSPVDVAAGLQEANEARLAVVDEDGFRFAHALVRQTLLDTLPTVRRSELHRCAATILEAQVAELSPDARGALAERAATHWAHVVSGGRQHAARLAVEAARSSRLQLGHENAIRLYRWACDLGDDRVETLTELGETLVLAGRITDGRRTLASAAARAAHERRGEALARAVLASGSGTGGYEVNVRDDQQVVLLRDALAMLGDEESRPRAAALARVALVDGSRPLEERAALAEEAAAMAARLGDVAGEVAAFAARCDVLAGPDHVDDRLATTERMVQLARRQRDPVILLLARRHRLLALLEHGEIARVDEEIAAYDRTSEHLRVPLYSWIVPIWRGMRALMDGDLGVATEQSDVAATLGRSAGSDNADVLTFTLRFAIGRAAGSTAALDDDVQRLLAAYEGYPAADGMLAIHRLLTGRTDAAHGLLQKRMHAGLDSIPRDSEWMEALWNLGSVAIELGDLDAVEAVRDCLVPYADLWVVDGIGAACFGSVSEQLGRLAAALGSLDEARRWLERAHEAHAAAGAHHLAATTASFRDALGAPAPRPARVDPAQVGELSRDGPVWRLRWQDESASVRHSKGVLDIARLVRHPGHEIHVLDLMDPTGSAPDTAGLGPTLDDDARRAYRRRLEELEVDLVDAADRFDDVRLARLEHERDLLIAEIAGAYGLGGQPRSTGASAERARKAVGMRIATAVKAIAAVHPQLGRHLDRSLVTGRYCSYRPEADVTWSVNQ